jgi:group I intron endonuclease
MESGVYMIKNTQNGKVYIGSSKNVNKRWIEHKYMLNNNTHKNAYLNNAWLKYGENCFEFSIIEFVELSKLIEREQHYIDYYCACDNKFGYNLSPNAGTTLGWKPSAETRKRMSDSAKKKSPISDETRKKLSLARIGNKYACRIVSDEERKKMSESHIGVNRGEKNGMAITDRFEIIAMRNDYDNGMRISQIMKKYNRKESFTRQIVKRERWQWLNDGSLNNTI